MDYNRQDIISNGWGTFREELLLLPYRESLVVEEDSITTYLADKLYNTTAIWWVLLEYNNIPPVPYIPAGTTINLFKLSDVNNLFNKYTKSVSTVSRGIV